jgi:hypothetical protein
MFGAKFDPFCLINYIWTHLNPICPNMSIIGWLSSMIKFGPFLSTLVHEDNNKGKNKIKDI